MAIVGSAYVEIHAITEAITAEIRIGLSEAVAGQGEITGARFGREFGAAAEAALSGPLAAMRAELNTAMTGAAGGVSSLTAATVNLKAAQADLSAATRIAVAAQREYTDAVVTQSAAQDAEVVTLERATVAHEQAAAARQAAASEAVAAAQQEVVASLEAASAEASSTARITEAEAAATEARLNAARAAQSAATAEVVAANEAAAGAVEAAQREVAAIAEANAARVAAATSARAAAAAQLEAAAAAEAAAARTAAASEASAASATRGIGIIKTVAAGIVIATLAVGVGSIKMAGDFQSATERLVTSAGETQANLDGVRAGILALTGQVGYSAEDLAAAMYKIESGGQHGAAGLEVLKAAAQGAKTENADLTTVSDALTSALTDYHLPASAAADVTSKLVAATSAGKLTFQDLAGSLSSVLPIASANHVALSDILGDLASMTVHGISAQQATQNLSDVIKHMAAPTAVQTKELAALGINSQQLSEDLGTKGLSGTLLEITHRIQEGMGPGSTKVIVNLQTALKGLPGPVQELGKKLLDGSISLKDYTLSAKALDPISAAQANQFKTLATNFYQVGTQQVTGKAAMQSYTDALRRATGDATGLNVALMLTGENTGTTENAIRTVSGAVADASGNVKGWEEIQSTFNVAFSRFKDGLGAGAIALGTKLLPALTGLLNVIMAVTDWFSQHQAAAMALAVVFSVILGAAVATLSVLMGGKLVGAIRSVGVAMELIGVSNPIFLAITLIVAAVVLLITNWQSVSDFLTTSWNYISNLATTVWGAIASFFSTTSSSVVSEVTSIWGGITGFFSGLWANVQNIFTTVVGAISSFMSTWGTTILAVIFPIIGIPMLISQHWSQIVTFFQGLWTNVSSAFAVGVSAVVAFFTDLPNKIFYALGFLVGLIVRIAITTGTAFVNGVVTSFNATISFFANLPQNLYNLLIGLVTFLTTSATNGAIAFGNAVVAGFNATISFFASLPATVGNFIVTLFVSVAAQAIIGGINFLNAVVNGFNATISFFEGLPGVIGTYFTGLASDFAAWAISSAIAFLAGVVNGFNATIAFFEGLPAVIGNFFANAGSWLLQAGMDILNGLVNGLISGGIAVLNWLGGLVSSFVQGFKDGMGISSPSTLFMQFGQWILEGLLSGLQSMLQNILNFVVMLYQSLISTFQTGINTLVQLWNTLWTGVQAVATAAFSAISSFIDSTWSTIKTLWNTSISLLTAAWNLMWNTIFSVAQTFWNNVSSFLTNAINVFVSFFNERWNNIVAFWTGVWNLIVSVATSAWNSVSSFLTNAINVIVAFITDRFNNILAFWTGVWNNIRTVATNAWNAISSFLTNAINVFVAFFNERWNNIVAFWVGVFNNLRSTATTVWNAIVAFLTNAINTFKAFFTTVWNAIVAFFTTTWNNLRATATAAWNAISSFLTNAFNTFKGFFNTVWTSIGTAFTNVWNGIKNTATTVWDSVVAAVKSGVNRVIDVINGITGGINVVLHFVGINPGIGTIPHLAQGGVIKMASGGRVGGGFMTQGPSAIVGEGNPAYPEYVIPTDPQFKKRAGSLFVSLGRQLNDSGALSDTGAPMMASGGKMLAAGGVISDIASWITGDDSRIKADAEAGVRAVTGGNAFATGIGVGTVDKVIDGAEAMIKKAYDVLQAALAAAASVVGLSGPGGAATVGGNLLGWIHTAEGLTGVGDSWTSGLATLIGRESGGNPNAINLTDSNARAGHPSQGLMQTIPSTFARYHQPGTSNSITDPVANISAGINYIKAVYGGIGNVQQANPNLPHKGYDAGGWLAPGLTLANNSSGKPEAIIPDPLTSFRTSMLDVFSRLAPDLMFALEAGSREQAQTLAAQIALNPERVTAIASAVAQEVGVPVSKIQQAVAQFSTRTTAATSAAASAAKPTTAPSAPPSSLSNVDLGERISKVMDDVGKKISGTKLADHITDLAANVSVSISKLSSKSPGATDASTLTHGSPGGLDKGSTIQGLHPEQYGKAAQISTSAAQAVIANFGNKAPSAGSAAQVAAQAAADAQVAASAKNPTIIYPDGAFQVHIHGNTDSVTVKQLQDSITGFGQHILQVYQGRK